MLSNTSTCSASGKVPGETIRVCSGWPVPAARYDVCVRDVIEDLQLGDHVALFYRNKTEQLAAAIPYILIGLERNERCLYIADDNSVAAIIRKLEEAGVNVREAQDRDALSVVTKQETYVRHGLFEPEKMIADLKNEVLQSLAKGFTGFRATGEMTWALDLPSAIARMVEYEEHLQLEYPAGFLGLCQYDETRYPRMILNQMKEIHPVIVRDGKLERRPEPLGQRVR